MILTLLLCVAAFGIGIVVGIVDCKRTFGIPHGATVEDGEWLTHETLSEVYGYHNTVSTEQ